MKNLKLHINSLHSRLFLLISLIVLLTILTIIFFVNIQTDNALFSSKEENAINALNTIVKNIEDNYSRINSFEKEITNLKKTELKNITGVAYSVLQNKYSKFKQNKLSANEAKRTAIQNIEKLRYANGTGYFWLNDLTKPIPRIIMHPTEPELNGTILDDEKYYCALGKNENLLKAMREVCEKYGDGYVDYLWSKPTETGLTERQKKLSYVKLFEPWGWIIGTGIYIEDLQAEINKMKRGIINEIKTTLSKIRLGEHGYLFLFNSDLQILIHPEFENADGNTLINPKTGNKILQEIIDSYKSEEKHLDYFWNVPNEGFENLFEKRAYIDYFEPLDWYVVSSVYLDEIKEPANQLQKQIYLIAAFFIILAFLFSLLAAGNVTKPIKTLVEFSRKFKHTKTNDFVIPPNSTIEIKELANVLVDTFCSLSQASEALRRSEDRLNKILIATNDGIFDVNYSTGEIYFDETYYKIAGYDPYEFPATHEEWEKRIHPDDIKYVKEENEKHLNGLTENYRAEYRYKTKNGEWIWVLGRGKVIERNKKGEPLRFLGTHTNISDRKEIEEKLKKTYELNSRFQDKISEMASNFAYQTDNFKESCKFITKVAASELGVERCSIWLLDKEKNTFYCIYLFDSINESEYETYKMRLEEYPIYFKALDSNKYIDASDAQNDPRTVEYCESYLKPLGILSTIDAKITIEGKIAGIISFESIKQKRIWLPEEITFASRIADQAALTLLNSKRMEANKNLQLSDEELRAANEELQSILYVASHDLRSPLVNISGFSSEVNLIISDIEKSIEDKYKEIQNDEEYLELKNELKESIQLIQLNTEKMNSLLSGLLRLSRLGKAALNIKEIDTTLLVQNIVSGMNFQINRSGTNIKINQLVNCVSDETLLNQIFSNLIDNAVKYLDPERDGLIEISGESLNEDYNVYCVKDNGIGIEKEYQSKIFELFQRVNPDSKIDGVGIGLSIIQKMLKKLKGDIWLKSVPGKGSEFFFKIPSKYLQ